LALHEYEKAREHLELALKQGYRTPELMYALGQVMGILYNKSLDDVEKSQSSKKSKEALIREAEKTYLLPAIRYLNESNGVAIESPAYVVALIAFYRKWYEPALKKTRQAFEDYPWFYEAKRLEGTIYYQMGYQKEERGDYEGALQDYGR